LVQRPLAYNLQVQIGIGGPALTVEYAGAAPGLVSGAIQVNIKLPDPIPVAIGYPKGTLPVRVLEGGVFFNPSDVTISVPVN